jgi:molecular chaperone HscB
MYFSILNIVPAFDIDLAMLEAEYFKAQRQYHPDRFIGKSAEERTAALAQSMDINQAYEALKNPLKRAQHLLKLQGVTVGTDNDSIKPSPALLMEIMELQEQFEEAKDPANHNKLVDKLKDLHAKTLLDIAKYYANKEWQKMAQETIRLGYLVKIADEKKYKKL